MKRFFTVLGSILGLLLIAATGLYFWASSGRLSDEALTQTRHYSTAPDTVAKDSLTVMTYNLGYLSGMTNNQPVVRSDSLLSANLEQALSLIQRSAPDVIGFQEIDYGAARSGYVQQLDTIASRLGYAKAAQAVNWDERYLPFPYGRPAVHFGRTLSGQAVLSQFPIRQHVRRVLPRPTQLFVRDAFYLDRLAQITILNVGSHPLTVINVHLEAYHDGTREEQARIVNALYDRLAAQEPPVLLIGDFNSTLPTSNPDSQDVGATEKTMQLLLEGTNLKPAIPDSVQPVPGTYPSADPDRKIDHIFYPPADFTPVAWSVQCGPPSPPSDHCAVTATFHRSRAADSWPPLDDVLPLDTLLRD